MLERLLVPATLEEYDRNVKGMAIRLNEDERTTDDRHNSAFEILKFTVSLTKHRSVHTLLQRATEQVARL